jgi:transposase
VRFVGHAPLEATVFEMERLRCNACGEVFTANEPEAAGLAKYDETAVAMIALLKYGAGVPFKRLERLQDQLGMPLPAATQWELMATAAKPLRLALEELIPSRATSGQGPSPAASYRWWMDGPSHYSSPDGSTRARTLPRF